MVLKVFIKVGKDRQPVLEDGVTTFFESDEIVLSPAKGDKVAFKLVTKSNNETTHTRGSINLATHGYELYSASAGLIQRFITKTNL